MMRLKKAVVISGTVMILLIVLMLYTAKDLTGLPTRKSSVLQDYQDNKWLHFEDRIKQLEDDWSRHHNAVHEIKESMKNILSPSSSGISSRQKELPNRTNNQSVPLLRPPKHPFAISDMMYDSSCPIQVNFIPRTNVQMLNVYKGLNFDNIDGGVWKQGWKIEVDEKDWNRHNKLKVFVVPHSHNDPGWIKTVEEYFASQTKHILDNMLNKLPEDPRRKFIWAEISYFSMWFDDLDEDARDKLKRLLRNNQLEIVTGGWVMNDEANSHWLSVINQLTEGHQWLQKNLNYTPISHWAIDPFGQSSTQAILLKEMDLQNMLIQRVHYSVKKELASKQQLEFRWRQLWDGNGNTEMFTHMMPFYSYDVPHTCGPDPKICCQFDFKRLPGHGLSCPWRVAPQPITEKNVASRAELLLDQYRKKSKLFKTNVVLAPLGDDFRYDHPTEWDVQYTNYQMLFDYMNSNLNLNVKIQFGTLSDYFAAVHKEKMMSEFPTLTGDFFTYADRDDHYWSGYYTSRPFYKRMDRILLSYVRAAESIHALAYLSKQPGYKWIVDQHNGLEEKISKARQALALFQHHDGITGTAKNHVVIDYAKKMLSAISACQRVIQTCVHILLSGAGAEVPTKDKNYYNIDDIRHAHDSLPEHFQITVGVPEMRTKRIVIYNSLTFTRHEVVTFHVSTPFIEVTDFQGRRIQCQVSPIFEYGATMSQTKYQLSFIANIPALGLVSYTVNALWENETPKETSLADVKIFNHYGEVRAPNGFDPEVFTSPGEFHLQNARVTASFNKLGLLKALKTGTNTVPVHLDFARYGVRHTPHSERSGAYIFLPDGEAVPIEAENVIVNVIEGPIMSSVTVQLPYVHHVATLYNTPGADGLGIELENVVDIEKTNNFELVIRLSTNINSSDEFFTDLNGYQSYVLPENGNCNNGEFVRKEEKNNRNYRRTRYSIFRQDPADSVKEFLAKNNSMKVLRRKRFTKLPLQANYYPIPTMAYIEDDKTRLTVLTASPLGCSSLSPGAIEVMLDRRLNQDDNRGLGQGVMDNIPTRHTFRIVLERRTHSCQTTTQNHPAGFPTVAAHMASQTLLNPMLKLLRVEDYDEVSKNAYTSVEEDFGVDFSMPVLKTNVFVKGKHNMGIVLHRQFLDVCFSDRVLLQQFPLSEGTVNISSLLPIETSKKMFRTSLSFSLVKNEVDAKGDLSMCPMEVKAFIF